MDVRGLKPLKFIDMTCHIVKFSGLSRLGSPMTRGGVLATTRHPSDWFASVSLAEDINLAVFSGFFEPLAG